MTSQVVASIDFDIDFPPKAPIRCKFTAKDKEALREKPALIYTHGSGGGLNAAAITNFVSGFAIAAPILCFQGNMNLASRTKMFQRVCADQGIVKFLGGRSMGARAAVMASTEDTTHLVLVSYPLHTAKDSRDQILLDLPAKVKVIFISGDMDAMCELRRLKEVCKKMKCKTWLVLVKGADHGMDIKPKSANGTTAMGVATGEIVARWLEGYDKGTKEATLSWQAEEEQVQWCGWQVGFEPGDGKPRATDIEDDKREDVKNTQSCSLELSNKRRSRSEHSASKRSAKKVKC